jgi:alpha-D-xyloside xylohydrolase
MRAMFVEFPTDPACRYLDRQYMLGPSMLVAPVFRHDNLAEYYLPAGSWTHLLTGKTVQGGHWRSETIGFMDLPLFVRPNTLLPLGSNEQEPIWSLADPLTLNLFQISDGANLTIRLVSSDGKGVSQLSCQRSGDQFSLTSDGHAKDVRVNLRSAGELSALKNGKPLADRSNPLLLHWLDSSKPLSFSFHRNGPI